MRSVIIQPSRVIAMTIAVFVTGANACRSHLMDGRRAAAPGLVLSGRKEVPCSAGMKLSKSIEEINPLIHSPDESMAVRKLIFKHFAKFLENTLFSIMKRHQWHFLNTRNFAQGDLFKKKKL